MQQMTHETLDTGLGSFRDSSPDYILAPVGLASMQDQAQKLAEYGRNGDVYIVHAAQGETVIPLEVLNANPKVKGLLYKQMRDMGLDPKEFVVGDELNSINPVTGLPEFFFKKIFRAVKKVVKKVVNVAKKIAPIALPIIAATFGFPFLGTAFKAGSFAASALAGGLGTLAQGGSFKDALKSGLIQGGIASLAGGLKSSYLGEPGGFMGGVRKSFAGMPGTPWLDPDTGQWFTGMDAKGVPYSQLKEANLAAVDPVAVEPVSSSNVENQLADLTANRGSMPHGEYLKKRHSIISQPGATPSLSQLKAQGRAVDTAFLDTGDIKKGYNWLLPKGPDMSKISEGARDLITTYPKVYGPEVAGGAKLALEQVTKSLTPGIISKYGKLAALGGAGAYALGAFDAPDVDQPEGHPPYVNPEWDLARKEGESDADYDARKKEHRRKYVLLDEALDPTLFAQGPYVFPPYSSQQRMFGADGGMAAYPRRELLVEGPGTERSDDIPAMLSDGEFVWNAKAVRGADPSGRGDRYAGARNLYDMMRNFEMKS